MSSTPADRHPGHGAITPLYAALVYATRGWPVLPLHTPTATGCSCGRAHCSSPGKHPRIHGGAHSATTDLDRIERYWRRWPHANVAIATGQLVVLDIDGPPGEAELRRLQHDYRPLPATPGVRTGRGRHLYFLAAGARIGNAALRSALHVRGHGGYAVAPPSRHASGISYRWTDTRTPAAVPAWLAALLQPAARPAPVSPAPPPRPERGRGYLRAVLDRELAEITAAPRGRRNITLNRAAFRLGQLAAAGLTDHQHLTRELLQAALTAGLPEREAAATIASGISAGSRHPRRLRLHS